MWYGKWGKQNVTMGLAMGQGEGTWENGNEIWSVGNKTVGYGQGSEEFDNTLGGKGQEEYDIGYNQ